MAIQKTPSLHFGPDGARIPIHRADAFFSRFLGLMGRRQSSEGLWLIPCASIHTFMMRFDLDVVFLSRDEKIVSIHRGMKPGRTALGGKGAWSAVEMPSDLHLTDSLAVGEPFPFLRT